MTVPTPREDIAVTNSKDAKGTRKDAKAQPLIKRKKKRKEIDAEAQTLKAKDAKSTQKMQKYGEKSPRENRDGGHP